MHGRIAPSRGSVVTKARRLGAAALAIALGGVLATAILVRAPARAEAQAPAASASASASPSAAPVAPPRRTKPAIAKVAETLAQQLRAAPARALVVAGLPTGDGPVARGAELAAAVAAQVAGQRGAATRAHPEPASLASARELARAQAALVYLGVTIAGGELRVTADLFPVPGTVWSRLRDPSPGPRMHAFASAPIDAEVRTFLPPIPLVTATVERGKNFESDVLALACGDLDRDGALEIVSMSRRRVTTLRLQGGRVQAIASRNWPDLAGVAPAPLREPIGFATIVERPSSLELEPSAYVDLGSTDRAKSVRLDGKLRTVGTMGGIAIPDAEGTACTRMGGPTITGPLGPCADGDPPPRAATVGGQYDAFASAALVTPAGKPLFVWVGREARVVEVRDDAGRKLTLEGAGAQLAVGDLEQDGEPEVLTSLDVTNPLEDAVVVRTWPRARPTDKPIERLRIPAAAGVHAIAVCPPDGPGRAPFVVATTDEIWVVR